MSFCDGVQYAKDHVFTDEQLNGILPEQIVAHLNHRAYGKTDPTEDERPTKQRDSTLAQAKKAISFFLPRQAMGWDPVEKKGNPTKAPEVNKVIQIVKKHQVRKEGVPSRARRDIEYGEFKNLLQVICNDTKLAPRRYLMIAILTLQWHVIGRVDDMMQLDNGALQHNTAFDFTLSCRMTWSKNIRDERDSPQQIILGSMDAWLCPLLNLVLFIEIEGAANALYVASNFLFGNKKGHQNTSNQLNVAINSTLFEKNRDGNLGTHSIRKGASTYAAGCGIDRDHVKRRGRWTGNKDVVDATYIATTLRYIDAKTANVLSGASGSCKYKLQPGFTIDSNFLSEHIATQTSQKLGPKIAATLALPLIWAVFDDTLPLNYVPAALKVRIKNKMASLNMDFHELNPVQRLPIMPVGDGARLLFVEITDRARDAVNEGMGQNNIGASTATNQQQATALMSQQLAMQGRIEDVNANLSKELSLIRSDIKRLHSSVKRLTDIPFAPQIIRQQAQAIRNGVGNAAAQQTNAQATYTASTTAYLTKNPRSLSILWEEFEFGVDGSKPAKEFTAGERGACKTKYCRRKVFWDGMQSLIDRRWSVDDAIQRVQAFYGSTLSVSDILLAMIKDRRQNNGRLSI